VETWITAITVTYLAIYYFSFFLAFFKSHQRIENRSHGYKGGISVLIPSYDEVLTVHTTIESVVASVRDFDIEIIVVDDGLGSDTSLHLKEKYHLHPCGRWVLHSMKTRSIRGLCEGEISGVPILVVDKVNGLKADALNAGLKYAQYDYFLCLDADSVLDKYALMELHRAIDQDTLALGGRVKPIVPNNLSKMQRAFTMAQVYEYARTFVFTRRTYETLHVVPLLSGAISLFHTDTVCHLGGYYRGTKAEDFELTLRIQRVAAKGNSIRYIHRAIVYTQVPFDIASLYRQRKRWYQGMMEVFDIHRKLFQRPTKLSLILHHMCIYEKYGCIMEVVLLLMIKEKFLMVAAVELLAGMIYTVYASYRNNKRLYVYFFTLGVFGLFFHYLNSVIKIRCLFSGRTTEWGKPTRMCIEAVAN